MDNGMKIKFRRMELGLTQKKLREMLNISPNKMCDIEKGKFDNVSYPLMSRIANTLKSTPQELFFNE